MWEYDLSSVRPTDGHLPLRVAASGENVYTFDIMNDSVAHVILWPGTPRMRYGSSAVWLAEGFYFAQRCKFC